VKIGPKLSHFLKKEEIKIIRAALPPTWFNAVKNWSFIKVVNWAAAGFPKDRGHVIGGTVIHMPGSLYSADYSKADTFYQHELVHEAVHITQVGRFGEIGYLGQIATDFARAKVGKYDVYDYQYQMDMGIRTTLEAHAEAIADNYFGDVNHNN
jgi:hypothetical protein